MKISVKKRLPSRTRTTFTADGDFEIIGVQCNIKNDEQKSKAASLTKGDKVTLKGKCTDVGEVLGYSFDIDEIE